MYRQLGGISNYNYISKSLVGNTTCTFQTSDPSVQDKICTVVVPHNAHLHAIWMFRLKSGKTMSPRYFLMEKVCDAEYLTNLMQQNHVLIFFIVNPQLAAFWATLSLHQQCVPRSVTLPHFDTKISWDPPH